MSDNIQKLSDYEHVRKRIFMYFGSPNSTTHNSIVYENNKPVLKELSYNPAIFTSFREILDNALDEVVGHGYGNKITIDFNPDNLEFTIEDNGRGIPLEFNKEENKHLVTLVLTEARAGRNFEARGSVAGTNGIGASATVFTSEYFTVEVKREGKKFTQDFREGYPAFPKELIIEKPKITNCSKESSGTKITCKPSRHVFETLQELKDNMILPEEFIRSRIYEVAICNPKVKFIYNGEAVKIKPKIEQNLFEDAIIVDIVQDKFSSKFFIVPDFACEGEHVHSIVNNIPAFNGGSHIDSFRRTFYKNFINSLGKESKRRKLTPNNSDIQTNLLIYNVTTMDAPNFDSQSKTRLINENAGTIVKKFLENEDVYKNIIKKNSGWINSIYERCAERTQKKDSSELDKLNKKLAKAKIPKLMEANGRDRSKCILLILEGESAKMGGGASRDEQIHALLDLRGKVMNVHGMSPKDVIINKEISDILNSVGLQIGKKANRRELRYGQIWLSTDADLDGANIAALLVNLFYTYWPELFDPNLPPFINVFQTPYLIAKNGKERRYWYSYNYHEYNQDENKGFSLTRAKGLGALEFEDWENSFKNPVLVPIVDDNKLKEMLNLIFNKDLADNRKEWMKN